MRLRAAVELLGDGIWIADLLPLLDAACVPRSRALLQAERGRSCSRSFATGDSQQFVASLTDLQLAYTHLVVVGQRLMDILKAGED
ncbi:hypothetical protein [Micromonospora endophytica]|uniref:Uncharacterized protein n=1 Tax=Micromonospora endophytica TaxID=515350 RepID=A0A2W2CI61_9ACTN|nr:hypothetical protein [Micromonospora endophytica]PZF97590.1 hypothetical protein C1I93_11305 [Micromonospora endophytica]RIW49533.1 hypothetical protein D3H59_04720 [Micromonospora endophytica]